MTIPADGAVVVLRMAAAGVKQREIARRLGLSRTTVARIVHRVGPHSALPAEVAPSTEAAYLGKAERCGGCGAMVVLEPGATVCLACELEAAGRPAWDAAAAACEVPAPVPDPVGPVELLAGVRIPFELKPAQRKRYEAIRARKQAAGEKPVRPSDRPPAEARFAGALLSRILEGGENPTS